ncbi:MAG TPA: hypothetical protein VNN10_05380 [Dehalococcoidia bacterium]|nr:hypothetical protein [Dehalococcoidia bacterium]
MARKALIVCANPVAREAIRKALAGRLSVDLAAEADSLRAGLHEARETQPEFAIVAQRLQDASDIMALRDIRDAAPAAKVVVLTWYAVERDWLAALLAGASACLLMEVRMLTALADVLERVAAGENLIAEERGEHLARVTAALASDASDFERELLRRICQLETDARIAEVTGVPIAGVKAGVEALARRFLPLTASR